VPRPRCDPRSCVHHANAYCAFRQGGVRVPCSLAPGRISLAIGLARARQADGTNNPRPCKFCRDVAYCILCESRETLEFQFGVTRNGNFKLCYACCAEPSCACCAYRRYSALAGRRSVLFGGRGVRAYVPYSVQLLTASATRTTGERPTGVDRGGRGVGPLAFQDSDQAREVRGCGRFFLRNSARGGKNCRPPEFRRGR